MKSWFILSSPESTAVELREAPVPEPKAGEVLVRIRAAGLNRGEFIAGHGLSGTGAKAGGIEGAGEVVKAGAGVTNFKAGDRIMGRASGAYVGVRDFPRRLRAAGARVAVLGRGGRGGHCLPHRLRHALARRGTEIGRVAAGDRASRPAWASRRCSSAS